VVCEIARAIEQTGCTAWYYTRDSSPGPSHLAQVRLAIEVSRAVLVVVSKDSLDSQEVTHEIAAAYECRKPFLPVLLGMTHAEFLKRSQPLWRQALCAATFVGIPSRDSAAGLNRIVDGLTTLGIVPPLPPPPATILGGADPSPPAHGRELLRRRMLWWLAGLCSVALVVALWVVTSGKQNRNSVPPRTAGVPNLAMEFVNLPAGEFQMGSDRWAGETPAHLVTISRPFEMGKLEVTQAQWKAVMGSDPSHFKGPDRPVENVSWNDVQDFLSKLNQRKDEYWYRLPTEAEWEYAGRAGGKAEYSPGELQALAWFDANSGGQDHAVGLKQPNPWGLYDMLGNVWEWCQDWYDASYYKVSAPVDPPGPQAGTYRVIRGGCWFLPSKQLRLSYRGRNPPGDRVLAVGFRCVRQLRPKPSAALKMEFVQIPAGEFEMGSNDGNADEKPVHRVSISRPFEMGRYEVTQAQWEAVMGTNPSHFKDSSRPVESVPWEDVQRFLNTLNDKKDGYRYRLPTEAEWEYAARAGAAAGPAGNLDAVAWYQANAGGQTHPAGQKKPNAWGLYDMLGNVWEWCADWYGAYPATPVTDPIGPSQGPGRVVRGGSWVSAAKYIRATSRYGGAPGRPYITGFRCVREEP
jgi:formylglycine-generating enzyme required for sulfatase activity